MRTPLVHLWNPAEIESTPYSQINRWRPYIVTSHARDRMGPSHLLLHLFSMDFLLYFFFFILSINICNNYIKQCFSLSHGRLGHPHPTCAGDQIHQDYEVYQDVWSGGLFASLVLWSGWCASYIACIYYEMHICLDTKWLINYYSC